MQKNKIGFVGKSLFALSAAYNTFHQLRKKDDDEAQGRTATDRDYLNMFSMGFMKENYDLTFYQAVLYYCRVEPIASGVDWIADEFEHIAPVIYNSKTKDFETTDHKLLHLLGFPNADVSGWEFRKQMAAYYLITGNCYVVATGTPGKEALELTCVQPQRVTVSPGPDGYAASYNVSAGSGAAACFTRLEVDGRFRFYSADGAELWHIRAFNPKYNLSNLYGMPKLNAIYYEIEQHLKGNIHNLSMLNRGARPSGALIIDGELDQEQRDRLRAQLDNASGAEASGHVHLLENIGGAKSNFVPMSENAKDSDYLGNRTAVTIAIYNRLKIPIPLISPEHMTLDNFSKAVLALYDNAVLPLADMMLGELTTFLGPRYKLAPTERLSYDENAIKALEPRRNEQNKNKRESGVLTINEIRSLYGYEEIENGDTLYQPFNLVAVGADRYTADNRREPQPKKEITAKEMYAMLKRQLDPEGKPRFTEAQLERYSK